MIRWRRHERADITERFPTESLEGPLLDVTNVETHFETSRGVVHAVDDVSFSLDRGRTLGVVGESGSGKTVLSRSVMGLLPKKHVIREGSIKFEGREIGSASAEEMRHIWGSQMAMIFQDPMTSLDPVYRIGDQIIEQIRAHEAVTKGAAARRLVLDDILIVAPFNMQVRALKQRLGGAARVGSVDKFQGQEAPVVIVSMCASTLDDAPRGSAFLLSRNRLNVAVSRAQALAIVVGSPILADVRVRTVEEMHLVSGWCRIEACAMES